jgi:hypothetical protein
MMAKQQCAMVGQQGMTTWQQGLVINKAEQQGMTKGQQGLVINKVEQQGAMVG